MATAKKTDKKSPKTENTTKTTETTETTEKVLKIGRDAAAKLLRTMGFKETQKYSNEILTRRLNKMKEYVTNYDGTLDGDTQELTDKVIAAKDHIKVTGDEPKGAKKDSSEKKPTDGKKPAKKSGESKKTKKRIDCICDVIKSLPKSGLTVDEASERANKDYIKAGGDDNLKQTVHHLRVILPAVLGLGCATMNDDGKLMPAS